MPKADRIGSNGYQARKQVVKGKAIKRSAAAVLAERLHLPNLLVLLRSRFSDLSIETHRGQQNIVVLFGIFLLVLLVSTVTATTIDFTSSINGNAPAIYRNFDQNDAEMICGDHMRKVAGESLLRYYVDDHSSRLDLRKGLWRIYLVADIGALNSYDEVNVHCFVSHYEQTMEHFRQMNPTNKMTVSTDLKFFKK